MALPEKDVTFSSFLIFLLKNFTLFIGFLQR